jgi:hypothetical protein
MEVTMNRMSLGLAATALAIGAILGSAPASADHREPIRLHVPVQQHGAETIELRKLAWRYRQLDLDDYRLHSVVLRNGPFSRGYASLYVDGQRSDRVRLTRHEHVRIAAPDYGRHDWRLRLGPGSQVRMVTLVLEPRRPAIASYRSVPYRPLRLDSHRYDRHGYAHGHRHGHGDARHDQRRDRHERHAQRSGQDRRQAAAQPPKEPRESGARQRSRDAEHDQLARGTRSDGSAERARLLPRLRSHHG